jgi:hypothetical membrane protein
MEENVSTIASEAFTSRNTNQVDITVAGLSFLVLSAQFMTVIMAAASMAAAYDLSGGAISDLGVNPATAPLFNGSLVITGVLNSIGAALLYRNDRRILPLVFGIIAAVGAIGAGAVTLSTPGVHGIFALVAFLFFNLQIIPRAARLTNPLRVVGLLLAAIGLLYVVIMVIGDAGTPAAFGPIGHGGAERMIVYPPMLWLMVYGGYLLGRTRD